MTAVGELAGLDGKRAAWAADAWRHVTADRLRDLISGLVDIPSPTGDEAPLATHIADTLRAAGCRSAVQPLDDRQANAWARLDGDGTGPDLMLYAPIDTLTVGDESEDLPGSARSCGTTCARGPPSTTTWWSASGRPTRRATRPA